MTITELLAEVRARQLTEEDIAAFNERLKAHVEEFEQQQLDSAPTQELFNKVCSI